MLVQGKNVVFRIFTGGEWRLYACATECSLSVNTSTIETSTTGSGDWVTIKGQKKSWSGSFSGVVSLGTDDLSIYDIRALQYEMTPLLIQIERTVGENSYTTEGTGIITGSTDTGNINDFATFSIDIQGNGSLTDTLAGISHMRINESDDLLINETDKLII